ncbi:acyltransferase [Naviculisporaceae sp. PSN 640]
MADPPSLSATELLRHLRGLGLVAPWLFWLMAGEVLLSLMLPFKILLPDLIYNLSSRLAYTAWRWIQYMFENQNGAIITTSGDTLPQGESAIVVCNHVAWCDFYMIQMLAIRAGMLSRCRWFSKIELRMVPFLGWGLWAMGMPMVTRNWVKDQAELERVFKGITKRKWPTWLVAFSEATRFTPEKYEQSVKYCEKHNKPQPLHLLYPRVKGFVSTVQHLRKSPHVKAVYDMTIAYQKGKQWHLAPNIWETLSCARLTEERGYKFHVHARRYELKDLPGDDEGLAQWLVERWVEKGEWLEGKRREWANAHAGSGK